MAEASRSSGSAPSADSAAGATPTRTTYSFTRWGSFSRARAGLRDERLPFSSVDGRLRLSQLALVPAIRDPRLLSVRVFLHYHPPPCSGLRRKKKAKSSSHSWVSH